MFQTFKKTSILIIKYINNPNNFTMKKLIPNNSAFPNTCISLQQTMQSFLTFPQNNYTLLFSAGYPQLVVHDQFSNTKYHKQSLNHARNYNQKQQNVGRKQDLKLFTNTLSRLRDKQKQQSGCAKTSEHQKNISNFFINQQNTDKSDASKSPLRQKNQKQLVQSEAYQNYEKTSLNSLKQRNLNARSQQQNNGIFPQISIDRNSEIKKSSKIQNNNKQSQNFFENNYSSLANFQKINSEVLCEQKLQISFQNLQSFIQKRFANENQKSIIQLMISSLQEAQKNQKSLIKNNLQNGTNLQTASNKREDENKKYIKQKEKQIQDLTQIKNPYAKQQRQGTELKKESWKLKQQIKMKLTDEQVCQIISSRKKSQMIKNVNEQQQIQFQKNQLRQIFDMDDFNINSLLKIEQNSKIQKPQQEIIKMETLQKAQNSTKSNGQSQTQNYLSVPTTKIPRAACSNKFDCTLQSSFVPHYFLNKVSNNHQELNQSVFQSSLIANQKGIIQSRIYETKKATEETHNQMTKP